MLVHEEHDTIKKLEEAIDNLRPGFAMDGGDINFVKYEQGVVYIHTVGSYIGYPSDQKATLEMIERELKIVLSEVERVEAI